MHVREIMTGDVECARPDNTVAEVAERMREMDVGSFPVCGENDTLVGMVTDRDITVRCTAQSGEPGTTYVRDVMTPRVIYCFDDDDVTACAKVMEENQVRRLPVLSRDKRLIGIVSLGDLAVRCGNDMLSGEALEQVSEPVKPQ